MEFCWSAAVGTLKMFFCRPVDVKKGGKNDARTTSRYAIRSGPKQFTAYLNGTDFILNEILWRRVGVPLKQTLVACLYLN